MVDSIDTALAGLGRERRVVASFPTAAAALELVSAVAPVPIVMSWPRLYDNDPAHVWLRTQARAAINCAAPTDSVGR